MKPRLAIVVQRWHPDVVGGSESEAWLYATYLSSKYEVSLVTSCARDSTTWANVFPAGESEMEGVSIRRFAAAAERGPYFRRLHHALLNQCATVDGTFWTPALELEWIRAQGPECPELYEHLGQNNYAGHIFMTYLYSTTHRGSVGLRDRSLLVPTLHDEPPAYLQAYRLMAREFRALLWNAEAERQLAARLWGPLPGARVGVGVSTEPADPHAGRKHYGIRGPYLYYCGRISAGKGVDELLSLFRELNVPGLSLVLSGSREMRLPRDGRIRFLGFTPEPLKFSLMAGATALVMPSVQESLSIVMLEAMAQGVPVIARRGSGVTENHIRRAGAGFLYADNKQWREAVDGVLAGDRQAAMQARSYVLREHSHEAAAQRLLQACARWL